MNRLMVLGILVWMGIALHAQSLYPDFSKLNFGCDGNSITAGEQWSKTVVDKLGFATVLDHCSPAVMLFPSHPKFSLLKSG